MAHPLWADGQSKEALWVPDDPFTPEAKLMRKRAPNLEWQIAESDADWERLSAPALPETPSAASRRWRLKNSCWGVVALLLLLTTGGYWWWRTLPGRMQQAEVEVTATAQPAVSGVAHRADQVVTSAVSNPSDADWWLQHGREVHGLRAAIQTSDPDGHLDLALDTVDVHRDQAVTRVVMYTEQGAPAYRQTRFYRRIGPDWRQTAPDATLWGPERRLETPSFVFHFRQNDTAAVIAVALEVETLYTAIRYNFGLPIPVAEEKFVIDVRVTEPPGQVLSWFGASDRIIVPSPAVYLAPVELTDVELLAQSIALALLENVQARKRHAIGAARQPLLGALSLWHVWALDLPLAAWREDVVRWLYANEPAIPPGQPVVLPDHYEALCAAHTLWMPSPAQLGIPLTCTELDGKNWYYPSWGPHDPLLRLDQLTLWMPPDEYRSQLGPSYVSHPGQTVALATLVEYAVATYGRERLPALVAGLGQYERWETLLPAVFGVSPEDFEAGWQAYLATRYGVSLDTLMQ
jgi:hypothetical protein